MPTRKSTSFLILLYFSQEPRETQKQPPEVLCKKSVLKNFTKFTGKHLCWSLFLIKLKVFRSATLLKRDSNTRVFFSVKFAKVLRTPSLKNICEQLLLEASTLTFRNLILNNTDYFRKLISSNTYFFSERYRIY